MDSAAASLLAQIAHDPRTNTEALSLLHEAGLYRGGVLRHPSCPPALLSQTAALALDSSQPPSLDSLAAFRHPLLPEPMLLRAVRSGNMELVAAAAANPDLSAELAGEIGKMVVLDSNDLLGAARLEEAKKLARLGWNVQQEL